MADDEQFSLCWNNFNSNLSAGFHESLCRGDLVDVTLAAEGQFVKAHRLVLSVCSPYFRKMFTQMPANQHAFVFLKDVSHTALKDLIQFMYCGEVNVKQEALPAFISTAEALQIKGLTDSDPPPSQSPTEPSTPTPPQIQMAPSPRVRQRVSGARSSYKIETVEDGAGDDTVVGGKATQIVIQTTSASQPQQTISQQTQQQQLSASTGGSSTTTVVTHKRPAQRSVGVSNAPHIKRTKSTIDPLDVAEAATTATTTNNTGSSASSNAQQITVQTAVVSGTSSAAEKQQQQQQSPEYIDLPIELPTKSEPDYTEEGGEVDSGDHDATYVEDDSYGELRYDESYFTENEDGATGGGGGGNTTAASAGSVASATTSKALIKSQQQSSFSDSAAYVEGTDQTNNDAQDEHHIHKDEEEADVSCETTGEVSFIRSQKKNAQLVYNGFIYNKKLTQANGHTTWRCVDVLKLRCKAVMITRDSELVVARRQHNHENHKQRIGYRPLYKVEDELEEAKHTEESGIANYLVSAAQQQQRRHGRHNDDT